MEFRNDGETCRVSIGPLGNRRFLTLFSGEIYDLPKEIAKRPGLKLTQVEEIEALEGHIGKVRVETKVEAKKESLASPDKSFEGDYTPDDLFFKELTDIQGIGKKTARDIVVWGTKEKLIEAIGLNAELPFRDDVELKLRDHYGKKL